MDKKQLKDYLKCAADLEAAVYSCEQAIKGLNGELAKPVKEIVVPDPRFRGKPEPVAPMMLAKPLEPSKPYLNQNTFKEPRSKLDICLEEMLDIFFPLGFVLSLGIHGISIVVAGLAALLFLLPVKRTIDRMVPLGLSYMDFSLLVGIVVIFAIMIGRLIFRLIPLLRERNHILAQNERNRAEQKRHNEELTAAYEKDMRAYQEQMRQYEIACR